MAELRLSLPDLAGAKKLEAWEKLENRLSAAVMKLPRVRRALEAKDVAGTHLDSDGVYQIWTGEHRARFSKLIRRGATVKPVPKGYRGLSR